MSPSGAALRRSLGLSDAVVIGAGSMIGTGVFVAWAPAAAAAGTGLLIGLAIAAAVAFCNATSSAQLAAVHAESGGTYVYGRRRLGPAWGHLAGWAFVVGKTASCAAMALAAGAYLVPDRQRLVAIGAVLLVTAVNLGGLARTVTATKVVLGVALATLAAVVVSGLLGPAADVGRLASIEASGGGVLRSAGFLFFAFAGYARIATLGEEVRDPERTIPRAIPLALGVVVGVYAVVGVTALVVVDADLLAASSAPLRLVAEDGRFGQVAGLVRLGASAAALGVLLSLVPGVARTALAMARHDELPAWLGFVSPTRSLPVRAEITVAAVVVVLVATLDLRDAIAVSGVGVLTYYAVTNAAALTLPAHQRRWPRGLAVLGAAGCLALIVALPWPAVVTGGAALALGVVTRLITTHARQHPPRRRTRTEADRA